MKGVQKEITRGLIEASAGYGRAGLSMFYDVPGFAVDSQVVIGNLTIAIELLLKGFIAKRSLLLLYKNLPLELRCALSSPDSMPTSFRSLPYELDLKSSTYKTLEFDEAIGTFKVFCPDLKKRLSSHFRFLSRNRNTCVHAVLPECHKYEVERSAFLFLTLVKFVCEEETELVKYISWGDEAKSKKFLEKFDEERLKRVHSKIEEAREKAKSLTSQVYLSQLNEDWNQYVIKCPVCGSDGVLEGETDENFDVDEDEFGGLQLYFVGERFECEECGLDLKDYEELLIAGIDPDIDRTDESDEWIQQFYSPYDL